MPIRSSLTAVILVASVGVVAIACFQPVCSSGECAQPDGGSGPNDSGTATDASSASDAAMDAGTSDAGSTPDGGNNAPDASYVDAGALTVDGGQGAPDGSVGPSDAGTDAGQDAGELGCANGIASQIWGSNMLGCDCLGQPACYVPVAAASTMCGTGWHICNLDEWNQRRGSTLSTDLSLIHI